MQVACALTEELGRGREMKLGCRMGSGAVWGAACLRTLLWSSHSLILHSAWWHQAILWQRETPQLTNHSPQQHNSLPAMGHREKFIPDNFSRRVCTSLTFEYGPDPTTVFAPILKKYLVSLSRPCTSVLKIFPDQKQVTRGLKCAASRVFRGYSKAAIELCYTLRSEVFCVLTSKS